MKHTLSHSDGIVVTPLSGRHYSVILGDRSTIPENMTKKIMAIARQKLGRPPVRLVLFPEQPDCNTKSDKVIDHQVASRFIFFAS
jgi:hypothetical protein